MIETTIFIAIFAAVFGIGAVAGATWVKGRQRDTTTDSQGWWML